LSVHAPPFQRQLRRHTDARGTHTDAIAGLDTYGLDFAGASSSAIVSTEGGFLVCQNASLQDDHHILHRRQRLSGNPAHAFQLTEAGVCANRRQHHIARKLGTELLIVPENELHQAGTTS